MKLMFPESKIHPGPTEEQIREHVQPWESKSLTREVVKRALQDIFPDMFVSVGGHHVALHSDGTGDRILLVTADYPDWL